LNYIIFYIQITNFTISFVFSELLEIKVNKIIKIVTLFFLTQTLIGCASQSAKMAHKINNDKESNFSDRYSEDCKQSIAKTNTEDYVFNGRMLATPVIGVLGLLTGPLILAANVSLDVKDRLVASEMSKRCGGNAIENKKIAQDVVVNGTLGLLLQGTNVAVYPGGEEVPVGVAAEATRN